MIPELIQLVVDRLKGIVGPNGLKEGERNHEESAPSLNDGLMDLTEALFLGSPFRSLVPLLYVGVVVFQVGIQGHADTMVIGIQKKAFQDDRARPPCLGNSLDNIYPIIRGQIGNVIQAIDQDNKITIIIRGQSVFQHFQMRTGLPSIFCHDVDLPLGIAGADPVGKALFHIFDAMTGRERVA